jgi:hypothetical protein
MEEDRFDDFLLLSKNDEREREKERERERERERDTVMANRLAPVFFHDACVLSLFLWCR